MNGVLKRAKPSCDDEWEFELPVSFVDVVFLLLIFFMCAAQFRSEERVLASNLPRDGRPDIEKKPEPPAEVRVKIFWESASGEAVADPSPGARVVTLVGRRRCVDPNELTRVLSSLRGRHERTPVVIDARRRVPFAWVIGAVDACARAGIENVRFRAPAGTDLGSEWWRL